MNDLPFKGLIDFLLSVKIWDVGKLLVCLAFLVYTFFAFVVLRQVLLMIKVLDGQLELALKVVALLNLALAIFLFFAALLTL